MWQRFTERARKTVFYAQEEAGRLGENYVSTEHLLLGLVGENDNKAIRAWNAPAGKLLSCKRRLNGNGSLTMRSRTR